MKKINKLLNKLLNKQIEPQVACITLVFCVFSILCWLSFAKGMMYAVTENVNIVWENLSSGLEEFESFWNERIFKKKVLSKLDIILTYFCTGESASSQVLIGKENWLFYKSTTDGDSIADYEGTNTFTKEEMENMKCQVIKIQTDLQKQGISFALLICPNKQNIYSELMPDEYVYSNVSRTDQLIQYFDDAGINVISPKAEMIENKNIYQLYYSYDTHWNQLGAYIAVKDTLASWGVSMPALNDKTITTFNLKGRYHYCAEDDLAKMLGLRSLVFDDEIEYEVDGTIKMDWDDFESEQNIQGISAFENPDAVNEETLLLIGDSFKTAMVPALREQFQKVYVAPRARFNSAMMSDIKPNYVIAEYVERYSSLIEDIGMLFEE